MADLRTRLRGAALGRRRCGLLASSGGQRLRADGLGAELPHMDAGAVARWFLDRWPDIRASDALEVAATEFSVQGLELDYAGLCWAGDLVRLPGRTAWLVRNLRGSSWQTPRGGEAIANRLNTYRVLLTRARYETLIWVPAGDAADLTRRPGELDAVVKFLVACGLDAPETPG
ncbi:MAG: DNA/RNA helicase domain-containing protein [Janthinobacterium lividum]